MDIDEQFEVFYDAELTQNVSLPFRITSRYFISACLASSDRKEVYMLTSRTTKERVILRRLPGQGEANHAEYTLLHGLGHPNIPKAIELFEEEGFSYFIRSYIHGASLHQWIAARGVAAEREAVHIIVQLCDILTYLHTRQPAVIHRDIKPQNLILDPDGVLYLIDFDISRKFDPQAAKDTMFMGTSATAPPEQYGYGQTDARSDLYSLGILLIFLCTGLYERAALAKMPARLRKIAETCTQFAPKERYTSAVQLKRALFTHKRSVLFRIAAVVAVVCTIVGAFYIGRMWENTTNYPASADAETSVMSAGDSERKTSVAEDGTVSFASSMIEELVREKLRKKTEEPVTLSDLQAITELIVVGDPSEHRSLPIDFINDQAYYKGELLTRGEIRTLSDLALMKSLNTLLLAYQRIDDLSPIKELPLRSLTVAGNYVSDLTPLAGMKTLRELNINNNPVIDLSPLKELQRLEALHIQQCGVKDIAVLAEIPSLTYVDVANTACSDYSPLISLPSLATIDISETGAQNAALVTDNPYILKLIAINCGIESLDGFGPMPNLNRLDLCNNGITDLTGIERYQNLKNLVIRNTQINDLSPLIGLPLLEELDLRGVDVDLSPLLNVPSLHKIICSPDMQSRIDMIKDEAAFEIEIMELL